MSEVHAKTKVASSLPPPYLLHLARLRCVPVAAAFPLSTSPFSIDNSASHQHHPPDRRLYPHNSTSTSPPTATGLLPLDPRPRPRQPSSQQRQHQPAPALSSTSTPLSILVFVVP
ncbi:uncharacterized protein BKA78DRAFT_41551 [Phyllosticta capitalensis]|uniref:uncharacterized protein n=1 Tax=Phyllosticta capitalensis TaxID=121624 RepID=UPI00312E4EBD